MKEQLSPREAEVVKLIWDGMAMAEVAKQLNVSDSTARRHRESVYRKWRIWNTAQLLRQALLRKVIQA